MAKLCFVVLAHKDASQIKRLVHRLTPHDVVLHLDSTADAKTAADVHALVGACEHVRAAPRRRTPWASWELVAATLDALRIASEGSGTHAVIMTGQDYLLQPVEVVADFCCGLPETSWMYRLPLPASFLGKDGGMRRLTWWNYSWRGRRLRFPGRRRGPVGLTPWYGQMQNCLSMELVRWILAEVDRRPELVRYFRWSWCPDEIFFHTLGLASPWKDQIRNENLWFVRWSPGASHPAVLRASDIDELAAAAVHGTDVGGWAPVKLFARKFDQASAADGLAAVDQRLLGVTPRGT